MTEPQPDDRPVVRVWWQNEWVEVRLVPRFDPVEDQDDGT